jgi:hypothetical protein
MSDSTGCASPPPNKAMSLELARALAEAADGLAVNEEEFFVVARYEPITDQFAGGFAVSGPYPDFAAVKDPARSEVCARTAGFFGPFKIKPRPANGRVVGQVDLHILDPSEVFTFPMRPDALFFTPAAVEKFALPFYERIFGPEFGAKVRDDFATVDIQVMAHYPWSEYSDGTRVPVVPVFLSARPDGNIKLVARSLGASNGLLTPVTVG